MGFSLGNIGKKLNEYEGAIGSFFGGNNTPAPAPTMAQRQAADSIGGAAGVGPNSLPIFTSKTQAPLSNPYSGAFDVARAVTAPLVNPFLKIGEDVLGSGSAGEETYVPSNTPNAGAILPGTSPIITNTGKNQTLRDQALGALQARLLVAGGLGKGVMDGAEGAGGQIINQASRFGNTGAVAGGLNALTTDQTQGATPGQIAANAAQQAAGGYAGGALLGALDKGARVKPGKPTVKLAVPDDVPISQLPKIGSRPANDIQTAIEKAHNAGDNQAAASLVNQLPPEMQEPMRTSLGINSNESAKVRPTVKLTASERSAGKALGLTDDQMKASKSRQAADNVLAADQSAVAVDAKGNRLISDGTEKYTPEELKAIEKRLASTSSISEKDRQATGNANPVKIDIPEVKPGDHAGAIVNSQRVTSAVDTAAKFALSSARALSKEDDALLPRAIEHPELVQTAKNPAKLQQAIDDFRRADDTMHAVNQNLKGEPTAYRTNHALHDWELPPELASQEGQSFSAVNEMARIHPTIEHGEAAGLTLKDRPHAQAMTEYFQRGSNILRKQALTKGLTEADNGLKPTDSFDLGGGNALPISAEGKKALKGLERQPTPNPLLKMHDATNKGLKQTLLSISQFHPVNIAALKAGPALALKGHPIMAARGVRDTFAAISKDYSEKLQRQALKDGTFDDAARIGTPIGTSSDYAVSGHINPLKHGIGERTIFEQQMPAMHVQMVKGLVSDLKRKGISLDSPEARAAGQRVNEIMGFVNKEVRGLDARTQRGLGRVLLAPQFTRSKWATLKGSVTERGQAGAYARSAVLGNTAALVAVQFGLGALFGQKQDNIRDTLIRALIHPSVATPFKDAKGNTIEFGLPSSYTSEAIGLGVSLTRGKDGRIVPDVNIGEIPDNLKNYGRARLAPLESDVLKGTTNEDYAGKPLYDPQASTKNKIEQSATTLTAGHLPIGLQGLVHTKLVEDHVPTPVGQVLKASDSNINPLIKSAVGALGLSARTDKTTGKGLQTTQYFDARNSARAGLDKNNQAAFDTINPAQKNPVTGVYQVTPSVWDSQDKATILLSHPDVLAATNKLNQQLKKNGQTTDPFYDLPAKQQSVFLTYSTLNQQDPQKTRLAGDNKWIAGLQDQRSKFFASLPPTDPNKPKAPVAYPDPSPSVKSLQDTYFKITDPTQKAQFIKNNPDLTDQFAKEDEYNRTVRGIKNLPQYDQYPTADASTQKVLNTYNALPKNDGVNGKSPTRSAWIKANPTQYAQMSRYLEQVSVYNLEQSAGQAAFQGQGLDQKGLAAAYSLGQYDINKTTDANGNTFYQLGDGTDSNSGYSSRKRAITGGSVSLSAGSSNFKKGSAKLAASVAPRSKAATIGASSRPKVSLKRSRV